MFNCSCTAQKKLNLGTVENGRFLVHCHKSRPTLVLCNTEGPGRIKVVTASQGALE